MRQYKHLSVGMGKHMSPRLCLVSSGEGNLGEDKPGGHLSGGAAGAPPFTSLLCDVYITEVDELETTCW